MARDVCTFCQSPFEDLITANSVPLSTAADSPDRFAAQGELDGFEGLIEGRPSGPGWDGG